MTSCRSKKSFVLFLKTIVFNALIPNILLSRLSDEQKCIFLHLKSADFETSCDWPTSSWRNNLDTPWCNNLVCNDLDDVITLWCDVKIVTPQRHVLFTGFGKLMFEYIFWYEVNQWLRAEREARSESISIYRRKVSMSGRPAGRGHALWTLISLERDDQFTNGHLNTMSPSNQSCIWPVPIPTGACHGTWHVPGRGCRRHPLPR